MAKQSVEDMLKRRTAATRTGPAYGLSTITTAPDLPERAGALPERLQDIARQYIDARQRSGEALLDAARWISEARQLAQYGEWQIFLEATGTSESAAKRLLDIHATAMRDPQFAEAIRTNWIGATVAAELARPSIADEKRAALLSQTESPKLADLPKTKSARMADLEPTAPATNSDNFHMNAVRMILADAARLGERSGTQSYQEAYQHAHQINDLTLRSRLFREIDRAVDGGEEAEQAAAPELPGDLVERAGRVGLNIWRSDSGYASANAVGIANYQDHATLKALINFVEQREAKTQRRILSQPKATREEAPSTDELASVQARWAALGYQLLPDLAGTTNDRYRLLPPKGQIGIVNMQWLAVLERLAVQEQMASEPPAGPRAALEARGWAFLPAESPSGWIRLKHPDLGYVRNEPTIDIAVKVAAGLQADYDRRDQLEQERGIAAAVPSTARWYIETHTRIAATTELITWCSEQCGQLDAEEQSLLLEDARQLIDELAKLIEAVSKGA